MPLEHCVPTTRCFLVVRAKTYGLRVFINAALHELNNIFLFIKNDKHKSSMWRKSATWMSRKHQEADISNSIQFYSWIVTPLNYNIKGRQQTLRHTHNALVISIVPLDPLFTLASVGI